MRTFKELLLWGFLQGWGCKVFPAARILQIVEPNIAQLRKKSRSSFEENSFSNFKFMMDVFTVSWSRAQDGLHRQTLSVCRNMARLGARGKALGVWCKMEIGLVVLLHEIK